MLQNSLFYCPYCEEPLRLVKTYLLRCACDEYPIVENIIYLKKDDTQLHKKIIDCLAQKKRFQALWLSLTYERFIHRCITVGMYWLNAHRIRIISKKQLLKILWILGPSRNWFRYLQDSTDRNTLLTAATLLQKQLEGTHRKNQMIADIGCGWGNLQEKISAPLKNRRYTYISLDKSMMSLLCAQLYTSTKASFYICCDVETGLPLKKKSVDHVMILDVFAWIYAKQRLIFQVANVLKKNGSLSIINVHPLSNKTRWWGYGITPTLLKKYLLKYFKHISFFNNTLQSSKVVKLSSSNSREGYSCLAIKN